jgi:cytochrome c oxidase subunit 2
MSACSGAQDVLNPAADQALHITTIWHVMLVVCGIMYALVLAFLAAAIWRARRSLAPPRDADSDVMSRVFAGWIALIVIGLAGLATASFLVDRSLAQADSRDALHIKITASQWWWKVEYHGATANEQVTTANELHLPVDRPVKIELQADDVIHSFWLPNLSGKQDLIPGRANTLLITPRRVGVYRGQCAEFCGLQHAHMALVATVESPATFSAWLKAQRADAPQPRNASEARGQQALLSSACVSCHHIQGTQASGQTGPDLTHMASRPNLAAGALPMRADALSRWLADPQAIKPGNHMPLVALSPRDRADVVNYLLALR